MKYLKLHTGHPFDDFGCAIFKKFGPQGHSTWIVLMCLWANDSADLTYRTGKDSKKVSGTYAEYHLTEIAKFCRRQPAQVLKLIQWLDDRHHFTWENREAFEKLVKRVNEENVDNSEENVDNSAENRQKVGKRSAKGRRTHGTWSAVERQPDGKICIFWPNIVKHNKGYYHFLSLLSSSQEGRVSQPKITENVDKSKMVQQEMTLTLVNLSRTLFPNPLTQGQAGSLLKSVNGDYTLAEKKVRQAKLKRNPVVWLMAFAHRPERYEKGD